MTYRSNFKEKLQAFDIILAKNVGLKGEMRQHYYLVVYAQDEDDNNTLTDDFVGLLITSNKKIEKLFAMKRNDYNAEIYLNQQKVYVCCDKGERLNKQMVIEKKDYTLTEYEKNGVMFYYKKYISESLRQLGEGGTL